MTPPFPSPTARTGAPAAALAALLAMPAAPAAAQETPPRPEPPRRAVEPADTAAAFGALGPLVHADRTGDAPALVLYPGGDALVRERIGFDLSAGRNTLSWPDPPDALDPTSLSLTFPGGSGPEVLSSMHRPAAAGIADALRGLVGGVVEVETDGGRRIVGRLVSARDALVLDTGEAASGAGDGAAGTAEGGGGRDVVVLSAGQVRTYRIRELPGTFRTGPEVEWAVRADEPGRREAELVYLSGGLSWDAHHVLELGREGGTADVVARAELENATDRTFRDASVKLVAGDVQRIEQGRPRAARLMEAAAARADDAGAGAVERAFGELRLFELPRAATLPAGATVRPLLFRARRVPVRKELLVVGGPDRPYRGSGPSLSPDVGAEETTEHARVRYALPTAEDGGVGHDVPAGLVRVYREDEDGTLLLAGEDRVGDVPRGDSLRVETGRSFRVTRTRVQTGFRRPDARTLEEDFRLELGNEREEPVDLRVVERLHRWDEWEIVEARLDGQRAEPRRLDVRTVDWRVSLPAETERELTYTVRYTLPPDRGR